MLYLVLDTGSEISWNIGDDVSTLLYASKVVEIQAYGDELELIIKRFNNIPTPTNCRIVNWFGDTAKFIVSNLHNMHYEGELKNW